MHACFYSVSKASAFAVIERKALHSAYLYQDISIGVLATPCEEYDAHLAMFQQSQLAIQ